MEKNRSEILERLMSKLTPEKKEKMKQQRIEHKNKLTAEWQLGYYVGENIVHNDLPSIVVENGTNKLIPISSEDESEYRKTESEWYNKTQHGKVKADDEWKVYQECRKRLIKKYLPNPLKCYVGLLNIHNMEDFKNGLITSLWNSDVCNYNLDPENIKIYDDDEVFFTVIELMLDKD